MMIIQCGRCGSKCELIPEKIMYPIICPSCNTQVPNSITGTTSRLAEAINANPGYKVFCDAGDMFNLELTLRTSSERREHRE